MGGAAGGTPLASAVGEAAEGCEGLYRAGDFGSSGIPRLEVFLLKKVLDGCTGTRTLIHHAGDSMASLASEQRLSIRSLR